MRLTPADLVAVNQRFERATPEQILRFAHETFGDRVALLSSMQRAGLALAHLADRTGLSFDVLFVDTGVLHQETLHARDRLAATHPRLRLRTLQPNATFLEQTAAEGVLYLTPEGQARCCDLRKSKPLLAEKGRYDALVGALRRGEGGKRSRVDVFAIDPDLNALRIHPFAHQSEGDLAAYADAHPDVVENVLHRMGFPTIGCFPCTTPVRADEDERAGRWRHLEAVRYCGINPTDGDGPPAAIDLAEGYREALLGS